MLNGFDQHMKKLIRARELGFRLVPSPGTGCAERHRDPEEVGAEGLQHHADESRGGASRHFRLRHRRTVTSPSPEAPAGRIREGVIFISTCSIYVCINVLSLFVVFSICFLSLFPPFSLFSFFFARSLLLE